jgi:hypothetical protein
MFASRCLPAAALALVACGDSQEPTRFVAAASDDGGGVSIGLTVQDGLVAGYACGDDPAREPYPGWFIGEANGDSIAIERDGWTFAATWSEGAAEGTLFEPSGEELIWAADAAAGGLSGTYAARDAGCTTGVIVIDGPQPLVRGAWCNSEGEQRQVTPLGPMQLVDGRLAVEVELATGARTLQVAPVDLPLPDDG